MPDKELDFVPYNRITSKSDAFVTSEELDCFIQYLPSTRATSYNIKKEQHTAGTTEDFQDYTIPDVSHKISPKKLRRINPFHKNNSESLLLNKFNTDPEIIYPTVVKEIKKKEVNFSDQMLNSDQIEFLLALQNIRNQSVKENETKLNIEEFSVIDDRVKSASYELDPRFSQVIVGKNTGSLEAITDETSSQSFEENQIKDYVKKFGFNPNEVNIKKKFEIRTGNLKETTDVNNFLQVVNTSNSNRNYISTGTNNTNNYNLLNINVDNKSGNTTLIRQSKTNNYRHDLNLFENKETFNYNTEVKLSKNSFGEDLDLELLHKKLLSGLNQTTTNNEYEYLTQVKNAKNYNIFEFKEVLNLTEKVSNNTNYVSLSTYYNHYRDINNNYNQIKNDLNFYSNQVDYLTKISFNNKNTINKMFNTYNTYRSSIMNMINNITKVQKLIYNENDTKLKAGLVKTISALYRSEVLQVNQLQEQLNLSNINISFINQRLNRYEINKIEQTKKELNNLLNIFDQNNFLSSYLTTKIGNVVNENNLIELLNLSTNENQIKNLSYILKQNSSNIYAVKNILELINITKDQNFNIDKLNSQNISNVNKILNLTSENIKAISSFKISNIYNNNTQNLTEEEVQQFKLQQSVLKNINLTEVKSFSNILRSYNSNEIKNTLNALDVNIIKSIQNSISILNSPDVQNVVNQINKFDKNFKISNNKISVQELKSLNLITEKIDVNKINNITRKISQLNTSNIEDIQQVSETINLHSDTFKNINSLSSKIQKISKISNITNLESKEIKNISKLENIDVDDITKLQNISHKEIIELINISKQSVNSNSFKISQNVMLSNQQVRNLINLSKSYNENILRRDTYLSNINQLNQISNSSVIQKISNNNDFLDTINLVSNNIKNDKYFVSKYSNSEIQEITNDLNVFTQNKTEIKKLSSIFNSKNIQNVDQSFVDSVNIFQSKVSNFADKSKLKETIESLNITNKNFNNIFSTYKVSQIIKKSELKENIQQINIFEDGKNSTVINKYSFESNKKKIQNLYSELNVVQENKIQRRTSQNISQVYNELNQVNKEIKQELRSILKEQKNIVKSSNNFIKAVSKSQNLGQQNLYDYLSFTNYSATNKTSNLTKYGDYNQVYNLLNVSKITENVAVNKAIKKTVNETIRLTQKTEKISFDIHKVNNEKVFKIFNTIKSTTNNYHEQREAEQKQEKLIEKKVDQLLTNKIELVTNNLVKNVLTKNEFDSIKRDIVYEILKVQNSTDEKLEQFKRETQQTVQTMLDKFLRS